MEVNSVAIIKDIQFDGDYFLNIFKSNDLIILLEGEHVILRSKHFFGDRKIVIKMNAVNEIYLEG